MKTRVDHHETANKLMLNYNVNPMMAIMLIRKHQELINVSSHEDHAVQQIVTLEKLIKRNN